MKGRPEADGERDLVAGARMRNRARSNAHCDSWLVNCANRRGECGLVRCVDAITKVGVRLAARIW